MIRFEGFWQAVSDLNAAGELPEWSVDVQKRSRRTRERILSAAYGMIQGGEMELLTMARLADEAGVSVGALYARFPSKEAVIAMLGLAVLEHGRIDIEKEVASADGARLVLSRYIHSIIHLFREHRLVIIEMRRLAAETPLLGRLIRETNSRIHEQVRSRINVEFSNESNLEYALFMASAAAREGVLYNALSAYEITPDDTILGREIHAAACAYLGLVS